MIGVLIIPTGIGAEIGGHAGDANPVCKLLASCCDTLITHPNVVNASDINEMSENTLYVEGSILDRFLEGKVELQPVRTYNKILVVANAPVKPETINAVNAARTTIGINAEILELATSLRMIAKMENGLATGEVTGWQELCSQVSRKRFDALAIHTPVEVGRDVALNYLNNEGGVNPWGGVEAKASKLIASAVHKPVAHAPLNDISPEDKELFFVNNKVVGPRMAAEIISNCYLHCVLKGLHKAPRILFDGKGISVDQVDFMVAPFGCFGPAHQACLDHGIPIIEVMENATVCCDLRHSGIPKIQVNNYWEAAGLIMAMKAGIHPASVRRPLSQTKVINRNG